MVSCALSGVQMRPRTNSGHSLSRFSVPLLPKPLVLSGVSSGNGSIKKNKTNFTDRADAHPTLIRERTPWCRPDSPPIRHDAKRIRLITPPKALSSLGRKSDPLYTSGLTLAFRSIAQGNSQLLSSTELRFLYQIASRLIVGFTIV
jgi:hypothetical protein